MRKLLTIAMCSVAIESFALTAVKDTVETQTHMLQNVTITEKRTGKDVMSSAPTHTLNNGDFNALGITDIADALSRLPSIALKDYGGAGGMKTVSVRGFGDQHTGVCYDGIALSNCQSGQIDLSRYSLDNVERMALTIGDNDDIFIPARNASAAAMLNIQTPQPKADDRKPHLTMQMRVGAWGYTNPFVRYMQSLSSKLTLSVMGEYIYAENDYPFKLKNLSVVTKEKRTNSRMNSGHSEVNFRWIPSDRQQLWMKLYYYDNDRQLPGIVRYYTNLCKETLHDKNAFVQAHYNLVASNKIAIKAYAKFNWSASIYRDPLYKDGINDADYWQREAYVSACVLWSPTVNWAFDYSVDYSFNNLNSSLSTDVRPFRNSILQSLTAKWRSGRMTVLARLLGSLYYNDAKEGASSRDMRKLSPAISLSYKVLSGEDLYIRASYKNIFRTPTFNESYFFHYGSTNLDPESTDQYNVGLTWMHHYQAYTLEMTVDGYINHVTDKIVAVPYNMFIWTNINVGKVRIAGMDATFNLEHKLNKRHALRLAGTYNLQKAQNRTRKDSPYYNYQLAYIPVHSGSASITYANPWADITLHATASSKRYSNNEHYEGTSVCGYMETGLTLYRQWKWQGNTLELRGDLKNLFNKQYEIVRGYPMPRMGYMITATCKF